MTDQLLQKIKAHAKLQGELPFQPCSKQVVDDAEQHLGFALPHVLKWCYLNVGNGGFGPGYGIIGLEGGHCPSHGNVVEYYELLRDDEEIEWDDGLLPFCEWGCNTLSCVDCSTPEHPIYISEDCIVSPTGYDLRAFFELWIEGVDILSYTGKLERKAIINPFTSEPELVSRMRRDDGAAQ